MNPSPAPVADCGDVAAPTAVRATTSGGVWRTEAIHLELSDGSLRIYAGDGTVHRHDPPAGGRWQLSWSNHLCATTGEVRHAHDGRLTDPLLLDSPERATQVVYDGTYGWTLDDTGGLWLHSPLVKRRRVSDHIADLAVTSGVLLAIDDDGKVLAGHGYHATVRVAQARPNQLSVVAVVPLATGWATLDAGGAVWCADRHPHLYDPKLTTIPRRLRVGQTSWDDRDAPAVFGITQIAGNSNADGHLVTVDDSHLTIHRLDSRTHDTHRLPADGATLLAATTRGALLVDGDHTLWFVGQIGAGVADAPVALGGIDTDTLALTWALLCAAETPVDIDELAATATRLS